MFAVLKVYILVPLILEGATSIKNSIHRVVSMCVYLCVKAWPLKTMELFSAIFSKSQCSYTLGVGKRVKKNNCLVIIHTSGPVKTFAVTL